jgi:hypothetical protein
MMMMMMTMHADERRQQRRQHRVLQEVMIEMCRRVARRHLEHTRRQAEGPLDRLLVLAWRWNLRPLRNEDAMNLRVMVRSLSA